MAEAEWRSTATLPPPSCNNKELMVISDKCSHICSKKKESSVNGGSLKKYVNF
jgi:hypothetical protein